MAPSNLPFDPADTRADMPVPPAAPQTPPPAMPRPMPRPVRPVAPAMAAPEPAPQAEITAMPRPAGAKGEPEDIFSDLESPRATMTPPPKGMAAGMAGGPRRSGHTMVAALALLVAFGSLGAALWFFVLRKAEPPLPSPTTPITEQPAASEPETTLTPEPSYPVETSPFPTSAPVTTPPDGVNIPPPTPVTGEVPASPAATTTETAPVADVDTDNDGLTDRRELELGLDANNPDGDSDGLKDGAEVLEYSTNPANPDTDGDGYLDGMEVGNGYDPRGTGQCAKPDCRVSS